MIILIDLVFGDPSTTYMMQMVEFSVIISPDYCTCRVGMKRVSVERNNLHDVFLTSVVKV